MKNIIAVVLLSVVACGPKPKAPDVASIPLPMTLEDAVASDFRTPANRARDQYRHPLETLQFFGLKADMTVVEIWPSAGWYSEIIAPYLRQKGRYIAALPAVVNGKNRSLKFENWLAAHPQVAMQDGKSFLTLPDQTDLAPAGSADMVLTFRNVHNWMQQKAEKVAFTAFFKVLKPGGILGVVEHRAAAGQKQDPEAKNGYVPEQDVIAMAKAAGFKFVKKSEINANPKDEKNYPAGVWTLPPVYRLADKDKAKYEEIGESDRMTLQFVKPR